MDTKIRQDSTDRRYFTMIPHLVLAYCRDPYDLALWTVIKTVAGEEGTCTLSTQDLADLAGMSTGKVSTCRTHLIATGLIHGRLYRDPDYPQPVWHLGIPDLWPRNIAFRNQGTESLRDRIKQIKDLRASLHHMKAPQPDLAEPSPHEGQPSPHEEGVSPHEGGISPHETKKNPVEPIQKPEQEADSLTHSDCWRNILRAMRSNPMIHSAVTAYLEPATVTLTENVLTVQTISHSGADTVNHRLREIITSQITRALRRKITVKVLGPDTPSNA